MFGQCPIFACLGLRSILIICEQTQTGEDGVTEYLQKIWSDTECMLRNIFKSTAETVGSI